MKILEHFTRATLFKKADAISINLYNKKSHSTSYTDRSSWGARRKNTKIRAEEPSGLMEVLGYDDWSDFGVGR